MDVPAELKYTKDHEWIRVEGDTATVGITQFAQDELGEIVFVELPDAGTEFTQKDSLCVVESTKAASDVYAPISGVVAEVNEALADSPEKINESPYQEGWLVKLNGLKSEELEHLLDADAYKALL